MEHSRASGLTVVSHFGAFVWCGKRDSPTRRLLLLLNAGTAEPFRVSPPEAVAYPLELALFHVYHNFVVLHTSLRQALAEPIPTNGHGSAKRWRPCTPAMAAGLTDHVWSLTEVLFYRVPPWRQLQTV